jgi:signal transduction histidine kinase
MKTSAQMNPPAKRPGNECASVNPESIEERFSALKILSDGIAHEIRNPLAVIQSLVERLAQKTEDPLQKELAEAIVSETHRLNRLLTEFLQYTQNPSLQRESIPIKTLIENALTFAIHPDQHSKITLHTDLSEGAVIVDPSAFHQVLVNVILNAVQAMKGEGILNIQAKVCKQHFMIQIEDEGPGIPEADLEKVFLPYFTTKRRGTGLGLALSHQIISRHGGMLYFRNNKEKGVTLYIDVPHP